MTVWIAPQVTVVLSGPPKPLVHYLHRSVVQVSLASNSLPLSGYRLSRLLCPLKCACPVRYPVLVLSRFCRQEKAEECQPASIQLLLSYWYSGHTGSSWVSAARAKEECGKWGDGERNEDPSLSCFLNLKIDCILPLFCIHSSSVSTPRLPPWIFLCFPLILVSLSGLRKHAL